MMTLAVVLAFTALIRFLPGGHPDLAGVFTAFAALLVALAAAADLSLWTSPSPRTPLWTAVLFGLALPVYLGGLTDAVVVVMDLTESATGPVRFVVEFSVLLAAPLAIAASPGFKVMAGFSGARRPSRWDPATDWRPVMRVLAVFIVAVMALIQLAFGSGVAGLPEALEVIDGIWAGMLGEIYGMLFILGFLSAFMLAFEQWQYD